MDLPVDAFLPTVLPTMLLNPKIMTPVDQAPEPPHDAATAKVAAEQDQLKAAASTLVIKNQRYDNLSIILPRPLPCPSAPAPRPSAFETGT